MNFLFKKEDFPENQSVEEFNLQSLSVDGNVTLAYLVPINSFMTSEEGIIIDIEDSFVSPISDVYGTFKSLKHNRAIMIHAVHY